MGHGIWFIRNKSEILLVLRLRFGQLLGRIWKLLKMSKAGGNGRDPKEAEVHHGSYWGHLKNQESGVDGSE
jgi:hypothetical protein